MHHSTTLMCHCEERSDVAISGRHLQPVQAIADRMQYCRGGDSRARRCTCARNRLPLKWYAPIASAAALVVQGRRAREKCSGAQ